MRKSLKFILLFLFAVFLLWFFGRNLDWQSVSQSLRRANAFYLILATLITCFGYFLRACRWKTLFAPITKTSLNELFAATTIGFSAILIVGRAGELIRPMWLSMRDKRVRPSAALMTLGVERIFDMASLICFFAFNLLWFDAPAGREREFEYIKLIGTLMLLGVVVGFVALYFYQKHSERFVVWFEGKMDRKFVPKKIRLVFVSLLKQLAASLKVLRDWREITMVVFWTLLLWFSIAIPTWLVILAFDLPVKIGFGGSLFVMFVAALGSVVPTPGGAAGAFHAATAGGLIFLNVEPNDAAAVSIAMHLVYFTPAVFFGIYYFLHGDMSVERFRSLLSSEHAEDEILEEETGRKGEEETRRKKVEERAANPKSQIPNPKSL
ncbi:MAG: lysylphosphatidylglycerol synthase transmembrane domain-containing protein [Pyrinomonadaceae bacterium]